MGQLSLRAAAAAALLALAGCQAEQGASPSRSSGVSPVPAPASLVGTEWTLVEIDSTRAAALAPRQPTVLFGADGRISGRACNSFSGRYAILTGRLATGPLAVTEMCGEAIDRMEGRLLAILAGLQPFALEDGTLRIGPADRPLLRLERRAAGSAASEPLPQAQPTVLSGTSWTLVEADGRRVAGVAGYAPVTLSFSGGRLGGHGGCNGFGGFYRVEGRRIVPGLLQSTLVGCTGPVGELERRFFAAIGRPFEYRTEPDGSLVLLENGRAALRFVRSR